jgi:hypothetical protein
MRVNIDKSSYVNLFENISRISNQKIVFKELDFEKFDNTSLEKKISFKVDETLITWGFNNNEGYFDSKLIPKICEVLSLKGIKSLIWSHDGLSHTILVGDLEFINKMSKYLNVEPC